VLFDDRHDEPQLVVIGRPKKRPMQRVKTRVRSARRTLVRRFRKE
jgi:hypothetical protein